MSLSIQSVSFGRGYAWIAQAVPYFSHNPLGWIGAIIVLFLISLAMSFIPILGSIAFSIFSLVVAGGYMLGCATYHEGGEFEFQHIFAGFQETYLKRLVLLGVFYTVASFAVFILVGILAFVMMGGFEFFQEIQQAQPEDIQSYMADMLLLVLIAVALFTPCIMAVWFAPAIIVSSDETVLSAMTMSFNACLKNILPFTLYGIIAFIAGILATLPFMLGFLVLIPVLSASVYVAFLDCFNRDSSNDPEQLLPR